MSRVKRTDDYLVLGHKEWLIKEKARVRDEFASLKPVGLTPSGRWAVKHVARGIVLAAVLVGGLMITYRLITTSGATRSSRRGAAAWGANVTPQELSPLQVSAALRRPLGGLAKVI